MVAIFDKNWNITNNDFNLDIFDGPTINGTLLVSVLDYYYYHDDWNCASTWDTVIMRFKVKDIPDGEGFQFGYRAFEKTENPCYTCKSDNSLCLRLL